MTKNDRVLILGYQEGRIVDFLRTESCEVQIEDGPLSLEQIRAINPRHIVSYGYRHIIKPRVVEAYPRVVNLHIALLPWNRGRNPNFWSWLENTPKGVTIHHIDDGIDTGPVLAQEEVQFDEDKETLASSYRGLKDKVETLFIEFWRQISTDGARTAPQRGKGTYHSGIEFEDYKNLLSLGWDTPVREIKRYGKEGGLWVLNERGERIK